MLLDDLPPEILQLIVRHVSNRDIRHLVSTSRQLYYLLQPSLFTNVKLSDLCALRGVPTLSYKVSTFLYAVVRNPKLANHVLTLEVSGWNIHGVDIQYQEDEREARFDRDLMRTLVEKMTGYSEGKRSEWLKDLEEFKTEAWMALLLPKLKGLRKLSMDWPYNQRYILNMLRKAGNSIKPVFPHLEEVYTTWWKEGSGSIPAYFLNPFFKFPSMRKLGCSRLRDQKREEFEPETEDDEPPLKKEILPPRSSNITVIDLVEASCFDGMREWFQACKTLRSFRRIGNGFLSHSEFQSGKHDAQDRKIYESLLLHKSTLEAIWMSSFSIDQGSDGWIGSFVDFTAMKAIAMTLPGLVGIDYVDWNIPENTARKVRKLEDVLPSSLETLYLILDEGPSFGEALDDLAELAVSEKFPRLAAIHLDRVRKAENLAKHMWLREICREAGIRGCFSHRVRGYRYDWSWMLKGKCLEPIWPFNEAEDLGWYHHEHSDTE